MTTVDKMFSRKGMHQHVYRAHGKRSRPEEEEEYNIEREPSKKKPGLKKNILWEILVTNGVGWILSLIFVTIIGVFMQLIANLIFKILIACFFFCYAGGYLLDYEGIPETPDFIAGTKNAAVTGMKAKHKGTVGVVNLMRAGYN